MIDQGVHRVILTILDEPWLTIHSHGGSPYCLRTGVLVVGC